MGIMKIYQEGTKSVNYPWHMYSCPKFPEICAPLAFARHIMASPTILKGRVQLFESNSQYDRFNTIFRGIVSGPEHCEEFVSLGMTPGDFGTHSIRKGTVTHVSTGSTASPPIASICLRANWAMPDILSQYTKFENAGDQFVGKCVSGRRRNSKTFAQARRTGTSRRTTATQRTRARTGSTAISGISSRTRRKIISRFLRCTRWWLR